MNAFRSLPKPALARLAGLGAFVFLMVAGGLLVWRVRGIRDGDALAQARQSGVIRIGYAVEAPYAFLTPDGKVTGESPEIARLIAERLGMSRVDWRLDHFGSLIEGLEARRFDVIAAGMFITPERRMRVAFSQPTFHVGTGLLVRKGNPHGLHSHADLLQKINIRIAVLSGSVEESHLLQMGCPEARLVRVPDALSGRSAVLSGHADALALSAPTIRWMVMNPVAGLTEMAEPFQMAAGDMTLQRAAGGFAFRKEDRALCRAWDEELSRFIGSEEHRRLVRDFGFNAVELPPAEAARSGPAP